MIRQLGSVLGPEQRAELARFVVWAGLYGVLQGLAVVLLIPIARSLQTGEWAGAWTWISGLAVTAVACSIAHYVQAMGGFRLALTALRTMHQRLGDHLVTLPLGWFPGRTGLVAQVASKGTVSVGTVPAHLLTPVIVGVTAPTAVTVAMLFFDWRLGLALLISIPVILALGRVSTRLIARSDEASHRAEVAVSDRVIEFARCQPVLRAFGRSHDPGGYQPLNRAMSVQNQVARRALLESVIGSSLNGVAVQAVFTLLVVLAAVFALGGTLTGIDFLALLGVASRFTGPLTDVADFGGQIRASRGELDRINAILTTPALPEPGQPTTATHPGTISFEEVGFGYEPGTPVLTDLSFTVEPGTMTALVGPSGSGKTTITRLIARFWDVDTGRVSVGGVDVRDQTTEALMAQLALVFQDVYVFDDTLRNNIQMGDPAADISAVERAAELAGVTEIVQRLPHGWDTRVGESGSALSGGERQRVSIARALLKHAPILLLDEATAALDPENERYVQDSLDALREHTTVLVIAHQLSTIIDADHILVLDETGRIAEHGTHDDLLARDGRYAAFWTERTTASGWRLTPTGKEPR
ncbi:ABC transporter [Auritidibacter sp. NML120779]|nr:ABC transporter [Auritidibacter sp. NML120779]